MQITNLKQSGSTLQVTLNSSTSQKKSVSGDIVLCGLIKSQIGNHVNTNYQQCYGNSKHNQYISIRLSKVFPSDSLIYSVKLSSETLSIEDIVFFVVDDNIDNACWQIFYDNNTTAIYDFDLALSLDVSSSIFKGFTSLHEDTELTDFELRGVDGSVKVHKAVLAGYSPVMKTMLAGQWKETSSNFVKVSDASEKTLKQLKDYMYLHMLPKSGIKELAVIASVYMMSDLEECCTVKLLTSITAENATDLLDFAVKYNMERLKLGILENIQRGLIKVEDMIKKSNSGQAMHPAVKVKAGSSRKRSRPS